MTTRVRERALGVALVLLAGWLAAGCDITVNGIGGDRFVEREKKDFQVSGTPDILLATFDGSIEVRAWDRPDVSVEIEKRGPDKEATDAMRVTATQSGNRITIEVKNQDAHRAHIGFSVGRTAKLIASVPRQANVETRSGDGTISIERVTGRVTVDTGDGTVRLADLNGEVRVHTGDGTVSLERVDGRVDAETGDGSMHLDGKLQAVHLKTGDGTVRVRVADGSRMEDDWDVRTGDGSLGLELPERFDADLDAHTDGGHISVTNHTVKGEVSKQTVRGQLGAGGRTLKLSTGDGPILISRS
ncbi:MAG: DUF4097 family beta strand repeat-containing protein [Bacteroidales bacterium]